MSDCRFGVSPVNYPDPDPDVILVKRAEAVYSNKDSRRKNRSFYLVRFILPLPLYLQGIFILICIYTRGLLLMRGLLEGGFSRFTTL